MPDISMCNGCYGCGKETTCYRHRASPNTLWQAYFSGTPMEGDTCNYYIEVKDESAGLRHGDDYAGEGPRIPPQE